MSIGLAQNRVNESRGNLAGLPTVDEVLDRYVKVLGGRAAIEMIKSSVAKGTMEIPAAGATGTVEFWRRAPNMLLIVMSVGNSVVARTAFDGKAGWSEDLRVGVTDREGENLDELKREADFYRSTNLKQLYPKMVLTGSQKEGETESYVIEATPEKGRPVKLYFEKATGLLVRTDRVSMTPQGELPSSEHLADYRELDGVKAPYLIRGVTPLVTIIFKLTEIKNNVTIDESKFLKPQSK
jgi:hypothetical protein